jgi:hypothetical protein
LPTAGSAVPHESQRASAQDLSVAMLRFSQIADFVPLNDGYEPRP